MDQSVFMALLNRVRKAPLAEDKFYLLQAATARFYFSATQCLDIVRCFAHSEDKAAIVDSIEKRLCTKVDLKWTTSMVKSAALSRDRLKILTVLLKHVPEVSCDEAKAFVLACFDVDRDREVAWSIFSEKFKFKQWDDTEVSEETTEAVSDLLDDPTPSMIFRCIENMAKSTTRHASAFDLPLLDGLSLLRKTIIEQRQAISDEVAKRHLEGRHSFLPSRVSTITSNLRPDRISVIAIRRRPIARPSTTTVETIDGGSDGQSTPASDYSSSPGSESPSSPAASGGFFVVRPPTSKSVDEGYDEPRNNDLVWNIVKPAKSSSTGGIGMTR